MSESEDRTLAMALHILGIFTFVLGPLIMWLILRREHPFVARHGRAHMNWVITAAIGYAAGFVLIIVLVGILVIIAVGIMHLVVCILNAIRASNGQEPDFPFSLNLVKDA